MKVIAPDGATWIVRRRWMEWGPHWPYTWRSRKKSRRNDDAKGWSWLDFLDFDEFSLIILAVVGAIFVLIFFVLPALIFILQLLIFITLLAVTLFLRTLLRRPWTVEAIRTGPDPRRMDWEVVGWWRSRRVIAEIAQSISLGHRRIQPDGATQAKET